MAQDDWIPYWPEPSQVELHYRKENGISYIDVAVTFPTSRYNVSDWGTPIIVFNNSWLADALMWSTSFGLDIPLTLRHSYDLGRPQAGEYDFYFRVWGMPIKDISFSVSYIPGDVNRDGVVDIFDLSKVGRAFGSFEGDPDYDIEADINEDGIVDMRDIAIVAVHYGETDS